MTRAVTIGEKVAVVEEQIKQMRATAAERHEEVLGSIKQIIENQHAGAADRAEMKREFTGMKSDIKEMKPHVTTIANIKTFWKVAAWIGGSATALWVGGAHVFEAVKQFFTLRGH